MSGRQPARGLDLVVATRDLHDGRPCCHVGLTVQSLADGSPICRVRSTPSGRVVTATVVRPPLSDESFVLMLPTSDVSDPPGPLGRFTGWLRGRRRT